MAAIPKWRQNTNSFTYYNRNPKKLKSSADCVARAISGATGIAWETVVRELTEIGIKLARTANEKTTYDSYLKSLGWTKQPQPKKGDGYKYTIKEFFSGTKGIKIVGVANHLTFVEDGILYDTWNCQNKTIGNYWTPPKS